MKKILSLGASLLVAGGLATGIVTLAQSSLSAQTTVLAASDPAPVLKGKYFMWLPFPPPQYLPVGQMVEINGNWYASRGAQRNEFHGVVDGYVAYYTGTFSLAN
ncbi:hypothetical protein [Schleiferilactobacillus shenzhenensis]|uniref:hypothetical protein n=1 Tax=Schleiferilactobacillus shenzhenensis TaxID=1231337 RepID=UPI0012DFA2DB|nr:hypothetical protein [Schleiferilactobacillus shenzhenensis]